MITAVKIGTDDEMESDAPLQRKRRASGRMMTSLSVFFSLSLSLSLCLISISLSVCLSFYLSLSICFFIIFFMFCILISMVHVD